MDETTLLTAGDLRQLGFDRDDTLAAAEAVATHLAGQGRGRPRITRVLQACLRQPEKHLRHAVCGELARLLCGPRTSADVGALRAARVPNRIWGQELLDGATIDQFDVACRLPVAARGAQMPDGHVGYGLPIGGVLATRGVVIPYAVGVDIACRMRLTVFDEPATLTDRRRDRLRSALLGETRFGVGAEFARDQRRQHAVMDDPTWRAQGLLRELHDKAWAQLGTSGSGNHFAEWGELTTDGVPELDLPAGAYLALLSHSGSRGTGAHIAEHFTRLAKASCRLPREAQNLAWLALDSDDGQAYWQAMTLAGAYAAANHELVHEHVAAAAGLEARCCVENHHNFAWLEEHDGEQMLVHRKGATPAGAGVLGVIPGSMGDAGYVVRGLGQPESLCSASHGAGRVMSRKQATAKLTRSERTRWLERVGVELLAGGLDESPQVYKRLERVMAQQRDLVEPVASFMPRMVLMAADGKSED
ncbi:MAG: RtcB family protein [Armatimonadetes bacterium]|nr:RtcB family protein [Armatimonadota bacterium]